MFKYIEIVDYTNQKVIKRIDVTNKSERAINRIDDGLNINLNHDKYFTTIEEYPEEQPLM